MNFLWEFAKGMTPLEAILGFVVLVALIAYGAWRDTNRGPRRYRPLPPEPASIPRTEKTEKSALARAEPRANAR
jgi:hypothetical protein